MMIEDFSRERVKQLMEANELSAYKIAKLSGFPKSTIGNYLQGRTAMNPVFLDSFCRLVGISVAEFFADYS